MPELKEKILKLEADFNHYKNKIERGQTIFIVAYFLPIFIIVLIVNKFMNLHLLLSSKIILFSFVVIGLVIYYYLRFRFQRGQKRYQKFFHKRLFQIDPNYQGSESFIKNIISVSREIFSDREEQLTRTAIKNSLFWSTLYLQLKIDLDLI